MRFPSLTGIKVLATLLIFYWHSPLPKNDVPDLGARCCELFFVLSGFLVACSRHGRFSTDMRDAENYVIGKVKRVYPVYIASLFLSILWLFLSRGADWLSVDNLTALPLHLLMSQAWFSGIAMLYNGAAWFLSALFVCYAAAPFIELWINKLSKRFDGCIAAVIAFIAPVSIRLLIECGVHINPDYFPISLHTFPLVRMLEFAAAYAVGSLFIKVKLGKQKETDDNTSLIWSLVELFAVVAVICSVVRFDNIMPRACFTILFIPFVLVFAIGKGVLSRMLAHPIVTKMGCIELEFYLLHQPIIRVVTAFLGLTGIVWVKKSAVLAFILTVICSLFLNRSLAHHRDNFNLSKGVRGE